jgi:hypothetical protein
MFEHNDVLHDQVCEVLYDARDEDCGCAVTARRVLKVIDAYLTAQPQENKELAENSPASPVQQIKAEIALWLDRELVCKKQGHQVVSIDYVIKQLRQLSAV